MGLLSDFTSYVDSLKRRGANTARELVADPMGLLGRNVSAFSESLPAAPGEPQNEMLARPGMQDWATGVAMNAPTMGLLGHTVYHGSPHKFDKFDASKIGTGEGAQAYGHGLYFAENPKVAMEYQKLQPITDPTDTAFITARTAFASGKGNTSAALKFLDQQERTTKAASQFLMDGGASSLSDIAKAKEIINSGKFGKGNLYKADLPDEWLPKMLDWDKPLSQQPEVQAAIKRSGLKVPKDAKGREVLDTIVAERMQQFVGENRAELTSRFLSSRGIPGIRYLDQGSRGAGEGSSNYVVFPGMEHLLKILERE